MEGSREGQWERVRQPWETRLRGTVPGVAQRGQSPKALPKGLLPFPGRHQGTRSGRCPLGGLKPGRKSRGTGSWRRLVGPSQSFETRNHTRDLSFTSKQVSFSVLSDLDSPRVTCISRTPGPSGIIHTLKCHENAFHGLFRVTNAFIFFPPLVEKMRCICKTRNVRLSQ